MPKFSLDAFQPNAKVSEYNCEFCGKLFYTKKAGSLMFISAEFAKKQEKK